MKGKEVSLLVVPCVALAIMGYWFRGKSRVLKTAPNPYAPVLDDVKIRSATPLEVSRGYDTIVTVKTSLPKQMPSP